MLPAITAGKSTAYNFGLRDTDPANQKEKDMNTINEFPNLFKPIRLGNTVFRNRIFTAPTSLYDLTPEGAPTDDYCAYYVRKAKGGCATVTLGECYVEPGETPPDGYEIPHLDRQSVLRSSLSKIADGVSRYGAVPSIELQKHGLHGAAESDVLWGPSDFTRNGLRGKAMSEEQILTTIQAYVDAAVFARDCGFGMVTIHAGHGWLLHQFLSPTLNKRTDKWGGSPENRARLVVTIIDEIKKKLGRGFPVEVRMSGIESFTDGFGIEGGIENAMQLDGHADLIHVSAGSFMDPEMFSVTHPTIFSDDGCNVKYAAEIKKHVKTPVATVGALSDPYMLEEIIASGKADVVEMARGLIVDPDLPIKTRTGREKEVRRCMKCFNCVRSSFAHGHMFCALNPESGRERETQLQLPRNEKKKVLIAGGGLAGMQAAITAKECGHEVILCEKTNELGGIILCERNVPFKKKIDTFIERQKYLLEKNNVDVRLNTEVTPEYIKEVQPDVVIAALGSLPAKPPIPGIDLPNVITARDLFMTPEKADKTVVILGGGLTGAELAIYMKSLGAEPQIVEMVSKENTTIEDLHMHELEKQGIPVHFNTKALEIKEDGVRCETPDGETFIAGNTIALALGQRPLSDQALEMNTLAEEFYMIGDCRAPRNIMTANKEGWTAGKSIGMI